MTSCYTEVIEAVWEHYEVPTAEQKLKNVVAGWRQNAIDIGVDQQQLKNLIQQSDSWLHPLYGTELFFLVFKAPPSDAIFRGLRADYLSSRIILELPDHIVIGVEGYNKMRTANDLWWDRYPKSNITAERQRLSGLTPSHSTRARCKLICIDKELRDKQNAFRLELKCLRNRYNAMQRWNPWPSGKGGLAQYARSLQLP